MLFTLCSIYSTNTGGAVPLPEKEFYLARGKPVGYLQVWSRIWTWDYREQIQLAVWARLELGASEVQVQCYKWMAKLPPISEPIG